MMSLPVWLTLLESSLSLVPFAYVGISVGVLCPGALCREPPPQNQKRSMHSTGMLSYYRLQTKFAKVMFLHLSVSHSVHGVVVSRPRPGGRGWGSAQGQCPGPGLGGCLPGGV